MVQGSSDVDFTLPRSTTYISMPNVLQDTCGTLFDKKPPINFKYFRFRNRRRRSPMLERNFIIWNISGGLTVSCILFIGIYP